MTLLERVNQAIGLFQAGDLAGCRAACLGILASVPDQPETLNLLGIADFAEGRTVDALRHVEGAIALEPRLGAAYARRAQMRKAAGVTGTGTDLARAVLLAPDDPAVLHEAAASNLDAGRVGAAFRQLRRCLTLDPGLAEAWYTMGQTLRLRQDPSGAADAHRRASLCQPSQTHILSDRFFARAAAADWREHAALTGQLMALADTPSGLIMPLVSLLLETSPAQQDRLARTFHDWMVAPHARAVGDLPMPAAARDRLTLGYMSADFHEHATAYLAAELFERHDRRHVRVVAYSYGPDDGSPMRRRLVRGVDLFRDIAGHDAEAVAAQVAADEVDILVDLKGHTRDCRFDLQARRMAPLQVAWLGYPGPLGNPLYDYVIGDAIVTPPSHQPWYREKLVLMPDSYQPNDRRRPLGDAPLDRAACGLPGDAFVLAALHPPQKIGPALFDVWMRLLAQLPQAVLWLFAPNEAAPDNLRREAARRGIDPARLVFAGQAPLGQHLARYRLADLALDSYPYTGHTTTSDALWVGCPVVTRCGESFAARVAASLLTAAGLPETITHSFQDYEATVLRLARDPAALAALRRRLIEGRLSAPLFDTPRFVVHLERAFRMMWDRHAAGLPPEGFAVPAGTDTDGLETGGKARHLVAMDTPSPPPTPSLAELEAAVRANPADPTGWTLLGGFLRKAGNHAEAIACHRRALELNPEEAAIWSNLGNALTAADRLEEAVAAHAEAVARAPQEPVLLLNRLATLRQAGHFAEALAACDALSARSPDNPDVRWERALARLQVGDYVHGFADYDARLHIGKWRNRIAPGTFWAGGDLTGRTLFLSTEQGFGDSLLAARYIPMAKQSGARIVYECHPELRRLYGGLGIDAFIDRDAELPHYDVHLPLLSLPRIMGTTAAFVPPPAPLTIPDSSRAKASRVLGPAVPGLLRVGIVWSGRTTFADNHRRATALTRFLRFAEIPGVRLYSLQKGPPEAELAAPGIGALVTDLAPHLDDFADTAAMLELLDLVIMTDSSVAHLAGTLGRPVWNLVQNVPYWIYGCEGDSTLWYPSMRLFRQGPDLRWEPVFDRAVAALRQLAAERAAAPAPAPAAGSTPEAEALYREAERAGEEGRHGDRQSLLQQLVHRHPRHRDCVALLAASLLSDRRLDAAKPLARVALRLDPGSDGALASQGAVMMMQGRAFDAEMWFRRAAAVNPAVASHGHNMAAARKVHGRAG